VGEGARTGARGKRAGWIAILLLVLLAGALRLAVAQATHPVGLQGDEASYLLKAFNLAKGRGHLNGAMRADWPPGNSWLLSHFVDSLPDSPETARLLPLVRAQAVVGTLLVLAAFLLARALFDVRVALLVAGAVAVYPTFVAFSHYLWSENLFAVLLTSSLWALVRARDDGSWGFAAAAGIAFGLATLTREIAAPVAVACAGWWVASAAVGRRRDAFARALLVVGLMLLVVAPWTARNYALFGRLVPVSTAGWWGMREGNTSDPRDWLRVDRRDVDDFRKRYRAIDGEMQRMDLARREALEHIRSEQPAWLGRKLLRNTALLFDPDSMLLRKLEEGSYGSPGSAWVRGILVTHVVFYWLVLCLGVLGVSGAVGRQRRSLALCVLAPFFIVHLVANANSRYRLPFLPLLMSYAGWAVLHPAAWRSVLTGRRALATGAALSALAVLFSVSFQRRASALWDFREDVEPPARIILFSIDTVRADRVGGFGSGEATPHLRSIAAAGTRFTRFYAASSYTIPSHMSIFTGLDPAAHGVISEEARLAPEVPVLAELLRKRGYVTQAFHEGVYVAPRFGFDRGFDEYRRQGWIQVVREALPSLLSWMREADDTPYFLFLHTYAPHFPYGGYQLYRRAHPERGLPGITGIRRLRGLFPPTKQGREAARSIPEPLRATCTLYNQLAPNHRAHLGCGDNRLPEDFPQTANFATDRAALLRAYDARLALVDRAIGRIRDTLVGLGQWKDTLLVVTSDHGEAFFEHGLYRHGHVPFEEVLRVPLVVSYPRLLETRGRRVVDTLAWHLDLAPTILRLAGGEPPASWRGVDLTPLMLGAGPKRRAVFPLVLRPPNRGPADPRRVAVRGDLKFIEGDEDFGDPEGLLFDLASDRRERTNLRDSRAREFAELAQAADRWSASLELRPPVHQRTGEVLGRDGPVEPVELSEEEREELRALGYVE
jgi:arylsulfatase A-like enzyme/4-amino-4-deoxy-L-arabinose transferase-like glycosyltransferase